MRKKKRKWRWGREAPSPSARNIWLGSSHLLARPLFHKEQCSFVCLFVCVLFLTLILYTGKTKWRINNYMFNEVNALSQSICGFFHVLTVSVFSILDAYTLMNFHSATFTPLYLLFTETITRVRCAVVET